MNLSTVLASIQQLIADPNPDDGLVPEITQEFKQDRALYESTARAHTARHAVDSHNATIRGNQQQHTKQNEMSSAHQGWTGGGAQAGSEAGVRETQAGVAEDEEEDESDEEDLENLWGETVSGNLFLSCARALFFCHARPFTSHNLL